MILRVWRPYTYERANSSFVPLTAVVDVTTQLWPLGLRFEVLHQAGGGGISFFPCVRFFVEGGTEH